jgi:hypothetical protein
MMPAYAQTQYAAFAQHAQPHSVQLSDEDRAKLTEIHEMINLLAKELTKLSQSTAGQYGLPMPAVPAVPYTYSFFQMPYGPVAFTAPRRF